MSPLRAGLEGRISRLRRLGVRGLLSIEADTLLRIVKATVAAAISWEAAALIGSPRPVLASLGAVLVVQVTVRATLARSMQLSVGVAAGLALAVLIGRVLGVHWWTIAIVVLGGLTVGELLRLGAFSSQVAISALLAYSLGSGYGATRVVDTLIGAAIGAAVNALAPPPSQLVASTRRLRGIAEDLGALLADVGAGLRRPLDRATLDRWLARARAVSAAVLRAQDALEDAQERLRFNHRGRSDTERLDRVGEGRRALAHAVLQTRGIVRTLLEVDESPAIAQAAAGTVRELGPLLDTVAAAVSAFGRLQERPGSAPDREHALAAAETGHAQVAEVGVRLAGLDVADPTQAAAARLVSSIVVDAERLLREVDVRDGSHVLAVEL